MTHTTIYILGAGAVGFPLALSLAQSGKDVLAVRTSRDDVAQTTVTVTVRNGETLSAPVPTVSLSQLPALDGIIVVTAKAHANGAIATALREKNASGPIVIMQNGLGVEKPFLDAQLSPLYRCILYLTAQTTAPYEFTFRPVTASPIGPVTGDQSQLSQYVAQLSTQRFPFRTEANIRREIWKKAIVNTVFNSICPLLDVDNGIFVRDAQVAALARQVVRECLAVTARLDIDLGEDELMAQITRISAGSQGQLISTLQDIRHGRPTEIAFLNLEITRLAATLDPPLHLPRTDLLGKLILAKSQIQPTPPAT